ncbi:MAG: ring-cleaving dioxygenase [Chitinophagaceae bacterium]|nr:MAG: ring-cleaving dioxygenase [Chitinophagaceae bacterium]
MTDRIKGIHHITAIAGDAQRNLDFYTGILGLRLVKKTVNFDDPGTYHLYYGNEMGEPGTILTFFPWKHVKQGQAGTGMATEIGYSVPAGSLDYWISRLNAAGVKTSDKKTLFGEEYVSFTDPDGLNLKLIVPAGNDPRTPWLSAGTTAANAIRGFQGITLTLKDHRATAAILVSVFGYKLASQEGNTYRFVTDAVEGASVVDIIEIPDGRPGVNAGGTNHHVAFRVKDDQVLMAYREKIAALGFHITPKIDRNYFYSLYFREPGGVLFEIASDNPGFAVDEKPEELGVNLKLPAQYEDRRAEIERVLPQLQPSLK